MVLGKLHIFIFIMAVKISELNIPDYVALTICFSFACKNT